MHDEIGLRGEPGGDQPRASSPGCGSATRAGPPWLPGRVEAVRAVAAAVPLGLASSSNRELIDLVLEAGGIAPLFAPPSPPRRSARGKPAPDVYLEAARRLGVEPALCAAVEDSHNGIRSAKAAGMRCVAIPNSRFPPGDAVGEADAVLGAVAGLGPESFRALDAPRSRTGRSRGAPTRRGASVPGRLPRSAARRS